jgi:signal transduction histidine kinase
LLSQQLLEVQEAERRHIARELHDEIGQGLTAVKVNLQSVKRISGDSELDLPLEESIAIVEHTLRQVRDLSLDLRPSLLDDLGVVAALRWYADRQAQRAGFEAKFLSELEDHRLPADLETTCFRVVQEALTNVVRHAKAKRVWIDLRQVGNKIELTIRDDGVGFDVEAIVAQAAGDLSLGILGMQERVQLMGGEFTINSDPNQGTRIRAIFPTLPDLNSKRSVEKRGTPR